MIHAHARPAEREAAAAVLQRKSDIPRPIALRGELRNELVALRRRFRRDRPDLERARHAIARLRWERRRLFEYHVRIRAADAERADAGTASGLAPRPVELFADNIKGGILQIQPRIRMSEMC